MHYRERKYLTRTSTSDDNGTNWMLDTAMYVLNYRERSSCYGAMLSVGKKFCQGNDKAIPRQCQGDTTAAPKLDPWALPLVPLHQVSLILGPRKFSLIYFSVCITWIIVDLNLAYSSLLALSVRRSAIYHYLST
jgi:hypothetical protein